MKTILITGGAGFIGSSLVQRFHREGFKTIVLDCLSPQIHGENPEVTSATFNKIKGISEFYHGDIRDRNLLKEILPKVEIVVHLAAETGTGQSMYDIANYCEVNVQGTAILLEEIFINAKNIKKLVVASSRAIYGEGKYLCQRHGDVFPDARDESALKRGIFQPLCPKCSSELTMCLTPEDAPSKPQSIYGITKLTQEELVLKSAHAHGIPAVALRFQNVYGPGQSLSNPYTGILSIFSNRARANKEINIFEDGVESRDFVYIDDVVESLSLAVNLNHLNQIACNVGSGQSTSVATVVAAIVDFFKSSSVVSVTGQFRVGDIRHNIADLTLAKTLLGFQPKIGFFEGVKYFLEWVELQENGKDDYEKSLAELRNRGLLK
jgi:dTDP-L-rhamnose 4-epimerase